MTYSYSDIEDLSQITDVVSAFGPAVIGIKWRPFQSIDSNIVASAYFWVKPIFFEDEPIVGVCTCTACVESVPCEM